MNNSFKISEDKLQKLESLLLQTPILLNDDSDFEVELKEVYRLIPRLKPHTKDSHLLPHIGKAHTAIRYYTLTNKKLNDYIRKLFNESNKELIVISEVTYDVGGFALPHFDPDSKITYNLMIGDSFEGGDVHLEEVLQDFYKRGDNTNLLEQLDSHWFHFYYTNLIFEPQWKWCYENSNDENPYTRIIRLDEVKDTIYEVTKGFEVDFSQNTWSNEEVNSEIGEAPFSIPKFTLDEGTKQFVKWLYKDDFRLLFAGIAQ